MRGIAVLEVLVINAVLITLLVLITENYGLRLAYWGPEGFAPSMTRYPLFFVTSAVKGTTRIPGLLSVDWQQVTLLVLLVVDGLFVRSALKGRRDEISQAP
jgi:hypothetical protein